jgi:hypothetical protein
MALHLEDGGLPVADIDHAGILAGAADHLRAGGRQLLQVNARGFVGAMLGPHHREDAEFGQIRRSPHRVEDALIFFGGKAVLGDDFGRDLGHAPRLSGTVALRLDLDRFRSNGSANWLLSSLGPNGGGQGVIPIACGRFKPPPRTPLLVWSDHGAGG